MTTMVSPVTRIEGHLKIDTVLDASNTVTAAKSTGALFRGFEAMLKNRDPRDAALLTQRACGVCPTPHAIASAKALENAARVVPTTSARLMRNIVLAANFMQSHILHFYQLAALDFVVGPAMPPWTPNYGGDLVTDAAVVNNYIAAIAIQRKCHKLLATFGGKMPHCSAVVAGGITDAPTVETIASSRALLAEITAFINGPYNTDVNKVAAAFPAYKNIGVGPKNFLSFGAFEDGSGNQLFTAGYYDGATGQVSGIDPSLIVEYVSSSYYTPDCGAKNPAQGVTTPAWGKAGAYSWDKAPRYNGKVCEVGPLARMFVSGQATTYGLGVSVLDRHVARLIEAKALANATAGWLNELEANVWGIHCTSYRTPVTATGLGMVEAPRGGLAHFITIANSLVANYQIVSPTTWNASPASDTGEGGAIEQALVGTKVVNPAQPVELTRVVHSFDPCIACAVH
jgi:hydrogenase large subunit